MYHSKEQDLQKIRSLVQNWNWETRSTPTWLKDILEIILQIDEHNKMFYNANLTPLPTPIRDKLDEILKDVA